MDKLELLKEANRRGILPESQRALFTEAVSRGLITIDDPPMGMMSSHGQQQPKGGWRQNVSTYAKPILETTGLVGGGFLGTAAGPAGTVGGAALGYGAGRQAGKILDNFLIEAPAEKPTQAVLNAGGDLAAGAAMEMGGQVIGKGITTAAPYVAPHFAKLRDFTKSIPARIPGTEAAAKRQASELFTQAQAAPESAVLSALQAKQAAEAEALMTRKGLDPNLLTPAQRTGSFEAGYLEQGATTANPKFAAQLAERDSTIATKARGDVTKVFPPNAPLTARSAQETGESIVSGLEKSRVPVKEAEREAWAQVSNKYQIDTPATSGAFTEIQSSIIPPDIKAKVAGIQEFYSSVPKTVEGLRAVESDLTQQIRVASRAGETNTVRVLNKIKDGIVKDFDALSEAAGTGKLFEYNGKLVNPELLTKEIQTSAAQLEKINAAGAVPDDVAVLNAIRAKGLPAMRGVGEDVGNFSKRMANDYRKYFKQEPPMIADPKAAESLAVHQSKIAANQEILAGMKPADDVAAQINAAKKATIERVERFDKGVTKTALSKGDEISGLRTTYESIPAKYFTQHGADDLIRAVGPKQAKDLMSEHVTASMEKLTKNGTLNVTAAMQFLQKNAPTLNKLKLTDTAKQAIAEQIPAAIRAKLDARMVVDNFGNEVNTLHEVRKIIAEFAPAIRATYKDGGKKELMALSDYHKILEILGRNKNVSYAKGSNSIDKLMGAAQSAPQGSLGYKIFNAIAESLAGGTAGLAVGGPIGGVAGITIGAGAKATRTVVTEHQKAAIKKILEDGITNPKTAEMLTKIAKGYKPKPVEMKKILGENGYEWTASGLAAKIAMPMMRDEE